MSPAAGDAPAGESPSPETTEPEPAGRAEPAPTPEVAPVQQAQVPARACPDSAVCRAGPSQDQRVVEYDHDRDGAVDLRTVQTYDGRGNVVLDETDMNADGVVDRRSWFTHDEANRMLTWSYDAADAHGPTVRGRHPRRRWPPTACDGVPDIRRTNVYDAAGNLLRTEIDHGVDATVEQIIHYDTPCPPPYGTDVCPEYRVETP